MTSGTSIQAERGTNERGLNDLHNLHTHIHTQNLQKNEFHRRFAEANANKKFIHAIREELFSSFH